MAIETELKLAVAPEQMNALKRHPMLKALSKGRATTHRLYSVYYDTPALDLRRHAMALRLRRIGRQWLQTLKGGGGVQAGLHQRNEWETPVTGEALDLDALKACGGKLPKGVRKQLQPVFITDFTRSVRMLEFEGAEIELALDSGEIRAGKHARPISELEFELKSGEPQQLFRLALKLLDAVPLQVEDISKAEHGYRLYSGDKPAVRKGAFPKLERRKSLAAALQNIIAACLLHIQANVSGALEGKDEEFLHQVRVGLRRLRVVLAMAEAYRADEELAELHSQVAAMCVEFGQLREWDVFVTQTLQPLVGHFPDHAGLRELQEASEKRRAHHRAVLERSLRSPDYQRLLLRFGAWMFGDYWHAVDDNLSLQDFAARNLHKRGKQVAKRGKHVASADAERLHLLRIACKKLRYCAEMFGSLYAPAEVRRYVSALTKLQDILGLLNDISVAHHLLAGMENDEWHEVLALVRGWLAQEQAEHTASLRGAWKRFSQQLHSGNKAACTRGGHDICLPWAGRRVNA